MANKKLTDLTELTTPADGDFLYIVDVSDTTESAQGTSKKIRKDKVDSGASKENIANKSSIYTTDANKYYNSTYINGALPTTYSKVVYVNATSPTTATIFDIENPPVTNDNALKNDTANLYIGADASTWVYLTGTGYVTKTVSSATSNFNTFGTSVDAGNSKTSHITRSGAVTLTGPLNILNLKIATTPTTSAGSYDILTRNSSTTALEKKLISDFLQTTGNQSFTGSKTGVSTAATPTFFTLTNENTNTTFTAEFNNSATAGANGSGALRATNYNAGVSTTAIQAINSSSGYGLEIKNLSNGIGYNSSNWSTGILAQYDSRTGSTGDLMRFTKSSSTTTYINHLGEIITMSPTATNQVATKGYTDGKITQTITNGITDKSPSEDAVFDALALKVAGSGTTNYITKFTASGTIGNSQIFDNGTNVGIGNNAGSPAENLEVRTTGNAGFAMTRNASTNLARFYFKTGSTYNWSTGIRNTRNDYSIYNEVTSLESFTINSTTNNALIGTTTDDGITTNKLQVNGNVKATQFRISALNTAPASATDTGTLGEVRITSTYIYVCTATNTWVRTALATW